MEGNGGTERTEQLRASARDLATEAHQLFGTIERGSSELAALVRDEMRRSPWIGIAAGFTAGYVLGGGLTVRLTGVLVAALARAMMANAVAAAARGMGEGAIAGGPHA